MLSTCTFIGSFLLELKAKVNFRYRKEYVVYLFRNVFAKAFFFLVEQYEPSGVIIFVRCPPAQRGRIKQNNI